MPILFFHVTGFNILTGNKKHNGAYCFQIFNHSSGKTSKKISFHYGNVSNINEYFHIKLDNNKDASFSIRLFKKGLLKDELISTVQYNSASLPLGKIVNERKLMDPAMTQFPDVSCNITLHLAEEGQEPYDAPTYSNNIRDTVSESYSYDSISDSYNQNLLC